MPKSIIIKLIAGCLCIALATGAAYAQQANPVVPESAATPADEAPALLAPEDNAVTTAETAPPFGVPALAWAPLSGATKYSVQISTSAGFADPLIDVTTVNPGFTPVIALADGVYFWRVRAFRENAWGEFSSARTFTKDWSDGGALLPLLLSPPDHAERTTFAPSDFSWQPAPGAATYLLEISSDSNFGAIVYSATTIKPHHTPPQRLAANTYTWRVTPFDPQGHAGQSSIPFTFIFHWRTAPQPLTPIDAIDAPFLPTFTWTAVEGAKSYRLEVDTEEDFPSPAVYNTYNTKFIPEKNLSNDAEYFWRVQAADDAGNTSEWSATRRFHMRWNFKPEPLAPPNNSILQSYPVFHWTPIPGIERYQLQVDESLSFERPLFDDEIDNTSTATLNKLQEPVILLDLAYYWRVRGVDAQDSLTPWSNTFTFQFSMRTSPNPVYPSPYYTPDAENLPTHDDHTMAWPLFVWDTAHQWPDYENAPITQRPDYYELTVASDPAFSSVVFQIETAGLSAAPTLDKHPFTPPPTGQLYYWRVRAMRAGQQLGSDTVRTTRIDPAISQLPMTDVITVSFPAPDFEAVGDPPALGWLPVNGATRYRIEISRDPNFESLVEFASPQFVNYTPWQGRRTPMPFGSYWWRVRAEDAMNAPLGDWSEPRRFNLSVDVVTGNEYDILPPAHPASILAAGDSPNYAPEISLVTTNTLPVAGETAIDNFHVMLNRVNLYDRDSWSDLTWVFAFSTAMTITAPVKYGIYVDVDHVAGAGAAVDPEGNAIVVDPHFLPEYVIYIDRGPVANVVPQSVRLYQWNGNTWNPAQALNVIGGDAWYDSTTGAVQVVIPYTAIGAGDEDFTGSLALTVLSLDAGAGPGAADCLPASRDEPDCAVLDNPVFVSDMLQPLYPFHTPASNPTVYHEIPVLRWRMPYFDSIDGYQLQIARDAKFTDLVETWEISESRMEPYFAMLSAAFQSLKAYGDNESYYWRVRIRHERYDSVSSRFDYGAWSPPMRFKLASRLAQNPTVTAGELVTTTPAFAWDRIETAAGYTIQIDNDANFSNPEINKKIDPNAFTLLDALSDGVWHWRVAMRRSNDVRGAWTQAMTFTKRSLTPSLLSPLPSQIINEQPTFRWSAVLTPTDTPLVAMPGYRLQIADDPNFSNAMSFETAATAYTLKPADSLADGTWHWRVAAIDGDDNIGAYSTPQVFYKEYLTPTLLAPGQGISVTGAVSFQWRPLAGAASYEIEIDDDPLFNSPIKAKTENTHYTPTVEMKPMQYYWRVRMVDADRQVGPFETGLVAIQPGDPDLPNRVFLPAIAR